MQILVAVVIRIMKTYSAEVKKVIEKRAFRFESADPKPGVKSFKNACNFLAHLGEREAG